MYGGGCNNSSSDDDNPPVENPDDIGNTDDPSTGGGDDALFTLPAPEHGKWDRPNYTYKLNSTLDLTGKKLKVIVIGKHAAEKPTEGNIADGLAFVMVDQAERLSKQYNVGWLGTAGRTYEEIVTPEDGENEGVKNGCDFTKIIALKFINYSYVSDAGWDCTEGTGVAVTVNDVKYEVIEPEADVLFELDAPGDGWTDAKPYDYELKEATNLTDKKLIVTGKHYKEKPVERAAAGLQCMFIDENGKEADQDACKLGWFSTEGSTLEVNCVAGDNAQEGFDLTKVKVLRFKNYSYVEADDYSHEAGSGVALSVTNVEIK